MRARSKPWLSRDIETIRKYHGKIPRAELAEMIGRTDSQLRSKICRLGIGKPKQYDESFVAELSEAYSKAGADSPINIKTLAEKYGVNEANIVRKAKSLGFTTNQKRRKVEVTKAEIREATKEERAEQHRQNLKTRWQRHPHPKGMLKKHHTESVKALLSEKSKLAYQSKTDGERSKITMKALKTKIQRYGTINGPEQKRGSWKAGWREIGGKRNYYRSMWEANYARYLDMLKHAGQIKEWQHEPKTFWFEKIMRGVRSYKPDFLVTKPDGRQEWHEVKGWLCPRSKTTLARMAKYYPSEKIVLINEKRYQAIRKTAMKIIPAWENANRFASARPIIMPADKANPRVEIELINPI
jgi:hypothetical protein